VCQADRGGRDYHAVMAIHVGRFRADRGSAPRAVMSAVLVIVSVLAVTAGPARAATSAMDALAGRAADADLDVMTFNLRYASEATPHSWAERRPVMRALLTTELPDLLGGGYDYIGTGRQGGDRGEFMAVFYRKDRLTPLAYGHFWLSDTPEVPGSETWGGFSTRMVTWVRFLDRTTGKRFSAVNTHLDNESEHARRRGARLIHDRLAAAVPALPVIMTGDFNTPARSGSDVYDLLVTRGGYRDAWVTAAVHGPAYATFHGYQPLVPGGPRIDWVLTTPGVAVSATLINTYRSGTRYPSDHLPVQARLRLP
jgi:endonuclease/exonuclease/phosphatase family metal-dependent hydrolase